jgi:hypothetical protein
MASDGLGPEDLTPDGLPTVRRGLDRRAVTRLLREAAARWAHLQAEHDELVGHIEARGGIENLTRDLREVGEHVSRMLGDAQDAAENLRSRARQEAAERRATAESEAADIRQEAERDAFKMRSDAWSAGSDLLDHVRLTAAAMIEQAEADVLITRAEAEQESHRRIAEARRQAGEITRAARNEGERAVIESRRLAEEIVAEAVRKAGVSEDDETDPATKEEPRGPTLHAVGWGVKVVDSDEDVEPTPKPGSDPHDPGYGDALAAEVERLRAEEGGEPYPPWHANEIEESERVVTDPSPVVEPIDVAELLGVEGDGEEEDDRAATAESASGPTALEEEEGAEGEQEAAVVEVEPAPEEPASVDPAPGGGLLSELFDRLRSGPVRVTLPAADGDAAEESEDEPASAERVPAGPILDSEAIDRRGRLLLPIHNEAVREVRRRLVDLQNEVLDDIRVAKRKRWSPELDSLQRPLAEALEPMVHGAAAAGATAAAELTGGAASPVLEARTAELIRAMSGALFADLEGVADRGAADAMLLEEAARVFRSWRNDVAPRWVQSITYAGYHDSLLAGLVAAGVTEVAGIRHGHLCAECPAASGETWDPAGPPPEGTAIPPGHLDCTCTVGPSA